MLWFSGYTSLEGEYSFILLASVGGSDCGLQEKIQQLNLLRERDAQELKQLKEDYNKLQKQVCTILQ